MLGLTIVQQTGNSKTLSLRQLDFSIHISNGNTRHCESLNGQTVRIVKCTDFRRHLQVDCAPRGNRRNEVQANTKLPELNRDSVGSPYAATLHHGIRKFAASQEASLLAILGKNVGLSEGLQQSLGFKSLNCCAEIDVRPEQQNIQSVRKRRDDAVSAHGASTASALTTSAVAASNRRR